MFFKIGVLKCFVVFTGFTCGGFFEKRIQHKCFLANIVKFLEHLF